MPRVTTKRKNKAGDPYNCDSCAKKIVAGEEYFEWSFRYGGTHRQHVTHGRPKSSQLTRSKMSGAYAAIESAELEIAAAESIEDLLSALESCAEEISNVRDEYQESFDNIPENLQQGGPAQEMQEKIDALESFADELQGVSLDEFDEEEPEKPVEEATSTPEGFAREYEEWEAAHSEWQEKFDEHLEEQRATADEALQNLSI